MTDLRGRTVVVTGGNTGLGLGFARGVGKAGARVAIWSRNASRNESAVAALHDAGITAWSVECDASDEAAVDAAMTATVAEYGRVDCMIANAGIEVSVPFVDTTLEQWRQVIATNLDGTFLCTRAAARQFVADGQGGAIVLLSSMASRFGGAHMAAYTTTKNGIIGLGRTLAVELARYQVRVNILVPGWTITDMTSPRRSDDRFFKVITSRTPVRRWATPEEFEPVAAFLADPTQTFHTGNEVVVDGGYSVF